MEQPKKEKLPGAGPFYFKGNKVGILILPGGGGGTSADLKPLAEDLHKAKGYTVHVALLPGFGTSPEDLKNVTIEKWKNALDEEIALIKKECDYIIVGGHSLGGVFTLILASKYEFNGIFTISAPIGINRFGVKFVPILKLFMPYHTINSEQLRRETNGKWVGYDKLPLNVVFKYKTLIKEMKNHLTNILCPAILFQGRLDSEIKKYSMDFIFENINSKSKKKVWLENNDHPILESSYHAIIVFELLQFITSP